MANQLISFRAESVLIELLEKNALSGESVNLCALRLLKQHLGVVDGCNGDSKVVDIHQLIEQKVAECMDAKLDYFKSEMIEKINAGNDEIFQELAENYQRKRGKRKYKPES